MKPFVGGFLQKPDPCAKAGPRPPAVGMQGLHSFSGQLRCGTRTHGGSLTSRRAPWPLPQMPGDSGGQEQSEPSPLPACFPKWIP